MVLDFFTLTVTTIKVEKHIKKQFSDIEQQSVHDQDA